jgi:heme A synthase
LIEVRATPLRGPCLTFQFKSVFPAMRLYLSTGTFASHFFQGGRKFELPKVADKVRLDTPLNHSAAAFSFLVVDAIAAAALCAPDSGSVANLGFRVFGQGD